MRTPLWERLTDWLNNLWLKLILPTMPSTDRQVSDLLLSLKEELSNLNNSDCDAKPELQTETQHAIERTIASLCDYQETLSKNKEPLKCTTS